MSATGYINVHAFTSNAKIPLQNAAVTITDSNERAIAFRLTNRNGQLDSPIEIEVPDLSTSQKPNESAQPYALVNIFTRKEDFEEISVFNAQVFADTVTVQNLELIPLSEFPESWTKSEQFIIPPQNL